jgi:hypothetical protein
MKPFRVLGIFVSVMLVVCLVGCGPQGRIKDDDEGSLVGAKTAGAATYNQLIAETSEKLLNQHSSNVEKGEKKIICFVDVENRGAEELGANKEAMYELMDTVIVNSGTYTNISRRYVEAALRKTGLRPDEIFLADGRTKFMSVLGEQGFTPDYLLWGKTTTLSTSGSDMREREYMLTMEMVDANTGLTEAKQTARVRKEYKK